MLLYRKVEDSAEIWETFVRMLKKVIGEQGETVIGEMMDKVFTKRNAKLNVNFFQFLARKIPASKKIILQNCTRLQQDKLRPAQLKQVQKLHNIISKQKPEPIKK